MKENKNKRYYFIILGFITLCLIFKYFFEKGEVIGKALSN